MYDGRSKQIATTRAACAGLARRRQRGRGVWSGRRRSGGCLSIVSLRFADGLSDGISSWAVVVVAAIFRFCCTVF